MRKVMLVLCLCALVFLVAAKPRPGKGKGKAKKEETVVAEPDTPSEGSAGETTEMEENVGSKGKGKVDEDGGSKGKGTEKKVKKAKHGGGQRRPEGFEQKSNKKLDDERKERAKHEPTPGKKQKKRKVTPEQKDKMKGACSKKAGGCKGQPPKVKARKEKARDLSVKARMRSPKFANRTATAEEQQEIIEQVERQLTKTQAAKKALLKAQGFEESEVEPADTGVWAEDIFLTEEQADKIVEYQLRNETDDENITAPSIDDVVSGNVNSRQKRYAVFMEKNLAAKWDEMPIPYVFDSHSAFTDDEKALVLAAIKDIETKTCIKFTQLDHIPLTPHIMYMKEDYAPFCGLSNLGRTGNQNVIYLNIAECAGQMTGTAAHETMHALGIDHEHTRFDRQDYVDIDFNNLDPQVLDLFELGDRETMSGYGTKYDYYSIMHYNAYSGGVEDTAVMLPLKEPKPFFTEVLGQREALSMKDGELLRMIYCAPECDDLSPWCDHWVTNDDACTLNARTMIDWCPKSCGFCPLGASETARQLLRARRK